jgi:FkbM family methyltransferase
MKDTGVKKIIKNIFFPDGSIRKIRIGPLRGMRFRVNWITGMAPWYSGTERGHQIFFERCVQPGDVVVDIGANWGLHTLYLSKLVGSHGKVIAMEPFLQVRNELEWHLNLNRRNNVRVLSCAISDQAGKFPFKINGGSTSSLMFKPNESKENEQWVQTETLDAILEHENAHQVRLIKIDVEGAETKVLQGAVKTLKVLRPHWVIALHTPEQDVSVARILVDCGYALKRIKGPPILRTDLGWPNKEGVWGDIVALPKEKECQEN